MKIPRFPLLSLLLGILLSFSPSVSFADITAVSKGGQSLLLYKDYYALVIGVSNYQKWPKILLDSIHHEMVTALTEMV